MKRNTGFPDEGEGSKFITGVLTLQEELDAMPPKDRAEAERELDAIHAETIAREDREMEARYFNPASYEDHKGR